MKKKFTTTLDENLLKGLKLYCLQHDIKVNKLLEKFIINLLAEQDLNNIY